MATMAVAVLAAGCSVLSVVPQQSADEATATAQPTASGSAPAVSSEVDAAATLAMTRYELVRDGDYEGACALYSEKYIANLIALAEAEGKTCAEAHALGVQNSDEYQATAAAQNRAGLTPFFYIPSAIEIDKSVIVDGPEGLVFLAPGTIVSLDPTEFEDGVGKVPGWLGSGSVKLFPDGVWRFIDLTET